jgi:hypothetical protein
MNLTPIVITETTAFLSKIRNWKLPGSDKIPNYWLIIEELKEISD